MATKKRNSGSGRTSSQAFRWTPARKHLAAHRGGTVPRGESRLGRRLSPWTGMGR